MDTMMTPTSLGILIFSGKGLKVYGHYVIIEYELSVK